MKQAFLVFGPPGCGNHLVTDILVNAGCIGHSGDHVDWRIENPNLGAVGQDRQPWDEKLPTDETPIVWRRSMPHGKPLDWFSIGEFVQPLKQRGYNCVAIVVLRDQYAAIQSMLKWGHVTTEQEGREVLFVSPWKIYGGLWQADVPYLTTTYEALVNYPEAQDALLTELGLPLPRKRLEVWDGNAKWYGGRR